MHPGSRRRGPPDRVTARLATTWMLAAHLACGGCGWTSPSREPASPKPLFLLISIDTLRADSLGFYGSPRQASPHLDALARESAVFEAAQTTAPWTLPAHASMLSGRYPSRHGLVHHGGRLRDEIPTLASLLANAGWATAAIVNSRYLSARNGMARGFERTFVQPDKVNQQGVTRELVDLALAWIDEEENRPLFLFIHTFDVHSDYRPKHAHRSLFERPYEGNASGFTDQLLAYRAGRFELQAYDMAHLRDLYDAGLHEVDRALGRLFEALRREKRIETSLIIVTSDHGEEFLDHGDVLHGRNHFEPVTRVPLLIRDPAFPAGQRITTPVSLVDILPTALARLGVPAPSELDGRDLTPLFEGRPRELEQRILFIEGAHNRATGGSLASARQGPFKLQKDSNWDTEARLYHLETDPRQSRDVLGEHPEIAKALLLQLDRFIAEAPPLPRPEALSDAERRHLASLGYLEADSDRLSGAEKNEVLPDEHEQAP